jgi:uncharacterized protein YwgA
VAIEKRDLLYIVLTRLGGSLLAGDALGRRILQDLVYIAVCWELPLDYEFKFSLKGPYSNDLVPDILHLQQRQGTFERRTRDLKLRPEAEERLESLSRFVDTLREDRRMLHLVASIMFLGKRYQMTRKEIVEYYQRFAPEYFPFEIAELVDLVNKNTTVSIR